MAPADPCYHGSPGTAIAEPPLAAAHRPDGTDRAPLTRDYRMLHGRGGSGGSARSRAAGVGGWACGRDRRLGGPSSAAGPSLAARWPPGRASWPPAHCRPVVDRGVRPERVAACPSLAFDSPRAARPRPGDLPRPGPIAGGPPQASPQESAVSVEVLPGPIPRLARAASHHQRVPASPPEPGDHAATPPLARPRPDPPVPWRLGSGNWRCSRGIAGRATLLPIRRRWGGR